MSEILTCSNCGYETSEVDTATELCQTCKNAYDLGFQKRGQRMKCKCCPIEVEVNDGAELCHYCYVRDCGLNPGKCANALTNWKEGESNE